MDPYEYLTVFVSVVLGQDWIPAVPAVQILAAYGALRALGSTNGALLSGSGNPRVDLQIGAWKLLLLGILIYPMTIRWGIAGTALATTIPSFLTQWLGFRKVIVVNYGLSSGFRHNRAWFMG